MEQPAILALILAKLVQITHIALLVLQDTTQIQELVLLVLVIVLVVAAPPLAFHAM